MCGYIKEEEESLPPWHHCLSSESVDLLFSGAQGLERSRVVGGLRLEELGPESNEFGFTAALPLAGCVIL